MSNVSETVSKDKSNNATTAIVKLDIYYGDKDPNKAIVIQQSSVIEFHLYESMFTLLPRLKLKLIDNGTWYNTFAFQVGAKLYMKMTPKPTGDDMTVDPWIDGCYSIQNIVYTTDQETQNYIYELTCIYGAEAFLNNVCVYPKSDMVSLTSTDSKTSSEVLETIASEGGLKYKCKLEKEPADKMAWLNGTKTCEQFARHVVSHAWIADDDMPIMYVDKNGYLTYDSLNRMTGENSKADFILDQRYKQIQNTTPTNKEPPMYTTYSNLDIYNLGIMQNYGAYKISVNIYNPYNEEKMDKDEYKASTVGELYVPSFRNKTVGDEKTRLAKISNKSSASVEHRMMTHKPSNMYFSNTHENYDIAPIHNSNIKKGFFQVFANVMVDTARQPNKAVESKYYNHLGDKVNLDTSDTKYPASILSGNYIICAMEHIWVANGTYTINMQLVTDGINSQGQLNSYIENKTKDSKK